MKNLAIILAVAILATYAFIAVNEGQKERAIRLRLPKFRKINKYEFDKALYQIRETRAKRLKDAVRPVKQINTEADPREDFYKDYEELENLRNSPSTEALPIQEPSAEFQGQQQEENIQQEDQQQQDAQTMTQELLQQQQIQPQEGEAQPEQPQFQRNMRSVKPIRRLE